MPHESTASARRVKAWSMLVLGGLVMSMAWIGTGTGSASDARDTSSSAGSSIATINCTGRNGPGTVNTTCIEVNQGHGVVDSIVVSMNSPGSFQLCDVTAEAWGTLLNGQPYHARGVSKCAYVATYAHVDFQPGESFQPDSQICATTTYQGQTGAPVCRKVDPRP